MVDQNKSLGKGLSSLISGQATGQNISSNLKTPYFPKKTGNQAGQVMYLDPNKIKTNPHQPRTEFKENALNELVESVKMHGIIQPLVVTTVLGGGYELIAGERRLRASKRAGLTVVPVIVRTVKELEKLELSLIENIQRHDLNAMEKANSYKKLTDEFSLTHEDAAKRLGISRPQFSNFIRLLSLPEEAQLGIASGKISLGQAKVMLEVKDEKKQKQIYQKAVTTDQTVADTQKEVRKVKVKNYERRIKKDPQITEWENNMQGELGTRVRIRERGKQGGLIEIEFYSEEELKALVNKISS